MPRKDKDGYYYDEQLDCFRHDDYPNRRYCYDRSLHTIREKTFGERIYDRYCRWTETSKVGKVFDKIVMAIPWPVYYAIGCVIGTSIGLAILSITK